MRGLVTRARAMAMRWRCPPDRLLPRSCDDGVVALRQLEDELVRAGERGRGHDALDRHGRVGERDVLADRAVEEHVLLQHDADLAAQPGRIDDGEIDAVDQHASAFGHVQPLHDLGERALARARGADDSDRLARPDI